MTGQNDTKDGARTFGRTALASLAAGLLVLVASGPTVGTAGSADTYVAGGTVVARVGATGDDPNTVLDNGGVVCNKSTPEPSVGGGCVPFGNGDSIEVYDINASAHVAFQVCIDNNGDSLCSLEQAECGDDIYFSHNDNGDFFNPLGPLPTDFRDGCDGGAWDGYVVLLCQGAHSPSGLNGTHAHRATAGSIAPTSGGSGFGDFCGGGGGNETAVPPAKAYLVF